MPDIIIHYPPEVSSGKYCVCEYMYLGRNTSDLSLDSAIYILKNTLKIGIFG